MEKKKEQLFEIWGKVGFIVHLSQMIEYTLANVLAFNDILREFDDKGSINVFEYNVFVERANCLYKTLEKKPLGFGIKKAKDIGYFEIKSQKWLEDVCAERNYVVHRLFKEDLFSKHLESDPSFYYERLEKVMEDMNIINNDLNKMFSEQKAKYKLIW